MKALQRATRWASSWFVTITPVARHQKPAAFYWKNLSPLPGLKTEYYKLAPLRGQLFYRGSKSIRGLPLQILGVQVQAPK